jgi:hypothetical protein
MNDLATSTPQTLAVAGPSVDSMIMAGIDKGITPDGLEKLCKLKMMMDAEQGRKDFFSAFAALQAEMPRVIAMKAVMNKADKGGGVRYTFAPFEDIMDTVGPYLKKYGFGVSFTTGDAPQGKICAICKLRHISGHSEENQFSVRIGGGPQGTSEAQADGAAKTYAKRGALCDALNIVVESDTDARLEGGFISAEDVQAIRSRVQRSGFDQTKFLKVAGSETFEGIRTGKLAVLHNMLDVREQASKQPTGAATAPIASKDDNQAAQAPNADPSQISEAEAMEIRAKELFDSDDWQNGLLRLAKEKTPKGGSIKWPFLASALEKFCGGKSFTPDRFAEFYAAVAAGRLDAMDGRIK